MAGVDLPTLVHVGNRLLATKLFSVAMYWLWAYDYLLTLGDEIKFGWSGKRSWIFVLFVANRYIPAVHIIYKCTVMFHFVKSLCAYLYVISTVDPHPFQSCEDSKWEIMLYTTVIAVLTQLTVALRVYGVTRRNKLCGGALSFLILAQLCFGLYFTVLYAKTPAPQLPQIDLDPYENCFPPRWRAGELTFITLTITFDLSAFSIVLVAARGLRGTNYPGIPSVLNAILRGATVYFFLMIPCQLVFFIFQFVAPTQLQLMPGLAQTMLLPIIASRLMLSVKRAAVEPTGLWSLSTMAGSRRGEPAEDGTLQFASQIFGAPPEAVTSPSEGDIELDSLPKDCGPQEPC